MKTLTFPDDAVRQIVALVLLHAWCSRTGQQYTAKEMMNDAFTSADAFVQASRTPR